MLRGIGLGLMTTLLVCCAGCAEQGQQGGNGNLTTTTASTTPASATPAATTTPATSPSPATPTGTPSPSAPTTATVKNVGNKWQDEASGSPVTTIKVGGTVTWSITGGTHSLRRDAGSDANGCGNLEASFDSANLSSGQSVTRTFNTAGTFGYHCGIHLGTPNCKTPPGSGAMPGVIHVVP